MAGATPEGSLQVTERKDVSRERQLANIALDPLFGGAALSTTITKGTFGATDLIGGDPSLETVGAIDGAANSGGQGARQSQRREGRKAARAKG
jgi:hypothetical protein